MKIIWGIVLLLGEGYYVKEVEKEGNKKFQLISYFKGYIVEDKTNTQREGVFKYTFKSPRWRGLEFYFSPPWIRYHYKKNTSYIMGLGDSDVGVKVRLEEGFGVYGFVRIPTGAKNVPKGEKVAKCSNNKWGGGGGLIFGRSINKKGRITLNIGKTINIGDEGQGGNFLPQSRVMLGIKLTFPYGIFIEGKTDLNRYDITGEIPIERNVKRVVGGIEWEVGEMDVMVGVEYGTWGIGDPPLHWWGEGWSKNGGQWDVIFGFTHPIEMKRIQFETGTIEGKVVDKKTLSPVVAKIEFKQWKISTVSDEKGNFTLRVPPGEYVVCVKIPGYKENWKKVKVEQNKTVKITFTLEGE